MTFLEDEIPLLRQIYEYDPTYHECFRRIVDTVANLFKIREGSFLVVPFGLYEKVDDDYLVIQMVVKNPIHLPSSLRDARPYSMCIHYFRSRQEWKQKTQQIRDLHCNDYVGPLNRLQFQKIYCFDF